MFQKATKKQLKLRLLLQGASGSGKTYSALTLASAISDKIALIDTEKGSASLYSDKFNFDTLNLTSHTPEDYIEAIEEAEKAGYEVLIIDSISHEWQEIINLSNKMMGNSFTNWAKLTPRHDKFVNKIISSPVHIIATTRSKQDYVLEEKNGKQVPTKVGMASIQRDGLDYEFTIVFEINQKHLATAPKDRTSLFDGKDFTIVKETGQQILNWLNSSDPVTDTGVKEDKQPILPTEDQKKRYFALLDEYCSVLKRDKDEVIVKIKETFHFDSHKVMPMKVYDQVCEMLENAIKSNKDSKTEPKIETELIDPALMDDHKPATTF